MRQTAQDFAGTVERRRQAIAAQLSSSRRGEYGQFFTPWGIARLMAGLFEEWKGPLHLLDPGAGTGVLAAAWTLRLCEQGPVPKAAHITAFEIDQQLIPALMQTLRECEELCRTRGTSLTWTVRSEDFVSAAVKTIQTDCLSVPLETPTAAILNPPYRKIASASATRLLLRSIDIEATNLYAAFVALTLRVLGCNGELVAITPRSFCNGPYFRHFRRQLLDTASLRRIHLFERRDAAFGDADVLQENVIICAVKGAPATDVVVSQSNGGLADSGTVRHAAYEEVVHPGDPESFIHVAPETDAREIARRVFSLGANLSSLGLAVSTGRVVDFRARERLRAETEPGAVPLVYPQHFERGYIRWPKPGGRKPNALAADDGAPDLVVPNGAYVLVKRFSAKEEVRRVVAAVCDPERMPASTALAFENHLNYYHSNGRGIDPDLARGLAAYLNSSLVDTYFRQFSGHTQVNATDLRRLHYPPRKALEEIGGRLAQDFPAQDALDLLVESAVARHLARKVS